MKIYNLFCLLNMCGAFVWLSACSTSKIKLSSKEKYFLKNWKGDYISLNYDRKAIKENRVNGIYKVLYSYNNTYYKNSLLCQLDTNNIKQKAFQIFREIKNVMNYKQNHSTMDIVISSNEVCCKTNQFGELISCEYVIRFNVTSLQSYVVSIYNNK